MAKVARIRYYEDLGFRMVSDFTLKRGNGSTWTGTFYCIDITRSIVSSTKPTSVDNL